MSRSASSRSTSGITKRSPELLAVVDEHVDVVLDGPDEQQRAAGELVGERVQPAHDLPRGGRSRVEARTSTMRECRVSLSATRPSARLRTPNSSCRLRAML